MNFEGKIIKLREIDKLNVDNILDNQDFKYKNNDISFFYYYQIIYYLFV